MSEVIGVVGAGLGGLGLFILAIGLMTDGLKAAAGSSLRHILASWTRTPARGIFSGFLMTAIVQSSGAVTVASLGFVNAGLLNMRQVLGIILGANIGTTMTGWLVAILGFNLNIAGFALPMVGIGMILKLSQQQGRASAIGQAIVGFGLFFIGLDVLKDAFEGITQTFSISQLSGQGMSGILLYLVIGIVITILTQSSSASIAITITAAASGMLEMYAAGAMIIGANIGTTSTAAFAAIGATSPAKRAAAAQVLFNLITAVVALLILPVLFYIITSLSKLLHLNADTAMSLALFHTLFNLLGLVLVYPFIGKLADWLEKRFTSWEETESNPRYIDKNIAQTPALATNALLNELIGLQKRVINLFASAIDSSQHDIRHFHQQSNVIKSLTQQVSRFIVELETAALNEETTAQLATMMRIEGYLYDCALASDLLASHWTNREKLKEPELEEALQGYLVKVLEYMRQTANMVVSDTPLTQEELLRLKDEIKDQLILAGTLHHIEVSHMSVAVDSLHEAWHTAKTWHKAATRLNTLAALLTPVMAGKTGE
ncbi:Na/Pi cotransporter family protein [Alteromonas lipolytica]|uniref:Sodium:phosphate symporter n=1 Tax=Alteromonas lipolytica TaxID=1856405 RepID=A0A1E8FDI3_9ALTE|nr:Na/Pi symporter [Alteromonas lipolytica]OFI33648.1 sodium:phosphate symporter [Alteromonas lipolytica]GGF69669.1 transporter [Alteromonas lipolytica]